MSELGSRLRSLPAEHPYRAVFESQQGLVAEARGDLAEAVAAQDRALARVEGDPARAFYVGFFLLRRSDLALKAGDPTRATADATRALELLGREVEPGAASFWVGTARLERGRALSALGREEEARADFDSALDDLAATLGLDHPDTLEARGRLEASPAPGA